MELFLFDVGRPPASNRRGHCQKRPRHAMAQWPDHTRLLASSLIGVRGARPSAAKPEDRWDCPAALTAGSCCPISTRVAGTTEHPARSSPQLRCHATARAERVGNPRPLCSFREIAGRPPATRLPVRPWAEADRRCVGAPEQLGVEGRQLAGATIARDQLDGVEGAPVTRNAAPSAPAPPSMYSNANPGSVRARRYATVG